MASDFFDFKQFRVYHNHCAMKVGTDSVLLGSLVPLIGSAQKVLDIGTGSGLLALMLAQRGAASIDAIEIDEAASKQCLANFKNSPWAHKLKCLHIDLQEFITCSEIKYDLIVSNPPYFEAKRNFGMDDLERSKARHDGDLPFADLAEGVSNLLLESGFFYLILPVDESKIFAGHAKNYGLFLQTQVNIIPKMGKPVKRVVQGYSKVLSQLISWDLILLNGDNEKSEVYHQLTKDFYLNGLDSR